jgi:putative acetyltransferase
MSAGTVQVLAMTPAHIAGYRDCLDVVARERRYLAQVEALPAEAVEEFMLNRLAEDVPAFVAVDAGRVVGWCDILRDWTVAKAHCGTLGMGILPEYRGAGLGRALLAASLAKAWAIGLTRIELEVRSDNLSAIRLYERLGFRKECLKRNAMRFDGVYYDAFQMSLLRDGTP